MLYPIWFCIRVVFHLPPLSNFFNLCTGPPISHSEESILWLLGRTVLVGGVTRGWPESLGYNNSLRSLFNYQHNMGWVEAGFANLLLFHSSPLILRESDCSSSGRCFVQLFSFRFFVYWLVSTHLYDGQFYPLPFSGQHSCRTYSRGALLLLHVMLCIYMTSKRESRQERHQGERLEKL